MSNVDVYTPLYIAAWQGHLEVVKKLVAAGSDVKNDPLPLRIAASRGHL